MGSWGFWKKRSLSRQNKKRPHLVDAALVHFYRQGYRRGGLRFETGVV